VYGKLNEVGKNCLKGLVEDFNHVKILAILNDYHADDLRYVVEAKWHGCTNPTAYPKEDIQYLDPSIPNDKKEISGAYWVSGSIFSSTSLDYTNNKQAVSLLSSEY
jgi:hypothetical protein